KRLKHLNISLLFIPAKTTYIRRWFSSIDTDTASLIPLSFGFYNDQHNHFIPNSNDLRGEAVISLLSWR
ncbi:hypothetical protein, partial [Vibrio sp. 10N.222.46.A1]|uniref:hypothetical protein n=1 Tax=Vibrio sp. 10N.222.46.A1 TaxID=3229599 RepID=UPI003550CCB0